MNESNTIKTDAKLDSESVIKKSKNPTNASSYQIKTRNLSKDNSSASKNNNNNNNNNNHVNNFEKATPSSNFGPYNLKPKKPQNSPLIYSTCQSILNTSSSCSFSQNNSNHSSFYLNPINKETSKILNDEMIKTNKNNKELVDMHTSPATAKIVVKPPSQIPAYEDKTFISNSNTKLASNLSRRTSFADLQKQKLQNNQVSNSNNEIVNGMVNYTTVTRMLPDYDEKNCLKNLPPTTTSALDPSFTNIVSGCAFNYCDSAASVLNQKLYCKLKKSNSVASNQYFSQYMDKVSWSKNLDKKLREKKKLSRSNMDITKPLVINDDNEFTLNDTKLLQVQPTPPPIPPAPLAKLNIDNESQEKRDVYSFDIDGKLTKSSSPSYINQIQNVDGKNQQATGVTYIKVDSSLTNGEVLINNQISEFRLDIEKQKLDLENEFSEKTSKVINEIIIDEKNEQEENKENVDKLYESSIRLEIDSVKEMQLKRLSNNLPKKTESFNYSLIKKTAAQAKKVPHSLAPFIIKSRQFFQQQIETDHQKQELLQTVNLKRNTSLPAKTLIRKNIYQFYDIKSKIKQFESSSVNFETNQQISFNPITSSIENCNNISKIPEDFQSNIKVKQLKNIFETGNNRIGKYQNIK